MKALYIGSILVAFALVACSDSETIAPVPPAAVIPDPPSSKPLSVDFTMDLVSQPATETGLFTFEVSVTNTSTTSVDDVRIFLRSVPDYMTFSSDELVVGPLLAESTVLAAGNVSLKFNSSGLRLKDEIGEELPMRWEVVFRDQDTQELNEISENEFTFVPFDPR